MMKTKFLFSLLINGISSRTAPKGLSWDTIHELCALFPSNILATPSLFSTVADFWLISSSPPVQPVTLWKSKQREKYTETSTLVLKYWTITCIYTIPFTPFFQCTKSYYIVIMFCNTEMLSQTLPYSLYG